MLLHEVGHALGALHEQAAGSLMNPVYDAKASRFGDGAGALMRAALRDEDQGEAHERFTRAVAMLRGGAVRAYEEASPLFAAYPDAIAVQDLRCQLAAVRLLEHRELVRACAPIRRLLAGDAGTDAASR
ncbi:MAG TPA: matrixin family metalloprotease [Polyangiaceae bacterium]|nr:matrixin family metalloprotease [Polyangiaceae bacterium]